MGEVAENLARVREELDAACRRAGRPADAVALMAVSKVHPPERMEEAIAAGQRLFGENRVQEWEAKADRIRALGADVRVHLIGPLQNNKTSRAAALFDAVDTVDSAKTAARLGLARLSLAPAAPAGQQNPSVPPQVVPVLVEVKLSPEESKHGVDPGALPALLESLAGISGLEVRGLMTVPPWSEDPEVARPFSGVSVLCATNCACAFPRYESCPWACPTTSPSRSRRVRPSCASALPSLGGDPPADAAPGPHLPHRVQALRGKTELLTGPKLSLDATRRAQEASRRVLSSHWVGF